MPFIGRIINHAISDLQIPNIGNWASELPIPDVSFEKFITFLPPGEEKDEFIRLIRKFLCWNPEQQVTSSDDMDDEEWDCPQLQAVS